MALGQNNEASDLWQENKTLTARVKALEEQNLDGILALKESYQREVKLRKALEEIRNIRLYTDKSPWVIASKALHNKETE